MAKDKTEGADGADDATKAKPKAAKVAVRLNHYCNKPGCEGLPGDVIDVAEADAAWLVEVGGGELVTAD